MHVEPPATVTLRVVEPVIEPTLAEMSVPPPHPAPAAVARPLAPMVATVVTEETQVAALVRSWVELSEKVPVAVSCSEFPVAIEGLVGVRAMDVSVTAADTVIAVVVSEAVARFASPA
jgi:hypothetical protein